MCAIVVSDHAQMRARGYAQLHTMLGDVMHVHGSRLGLQAWQGRPHLFRGGGFFCPSFKCGNGWARFYFHIFEVKKIAFFSQQSSHSELGIFLWAFFPSTYSPLPLPNSHFQEQITNLMKHTDSRDVFQCCSKDLQVQISESKLQSSFSFLKSPYGRFAKSELSKTPPLHLPQAQSTTLSSAPRSSAVVLAAHAPSSSLQRPCSSSIAMNCLPPPSPLSTWPPKRCLSSILGSLAGNLIALQNPLLATGIYASYGAALQDGFRIFQTVFLEPVRKADQKAGGGRFAFFHGFEFF